MEVEKEVEEEQGGNGERCWEGEEEERREAVAIIHNPTNR